MLCSAGRRLSSSQRILLSLCFGDQLICTLKRCMQLSKCSVVRLLVPRSDVEMSSLSAHLKRPNRSQVRGVEPGSPIRRCCGESSHRLFRSGRAVSNKHGAVLLHDPSETKPRLPTEKRPLLSLSPVLHQYAPFPPRYLPARIYPPLPRPFPETHTATMDEIAPEYDVIVLGTGTSRVQRRFPPDACLLACPAPHISPRGVM